MTEDKEPWLKRYGGYIFASIFFFNFFISIIQWTDAPNITIVIILFFICLFFLTSYLILILFIKKIRKDKDYLIDFVYSFNLEIFSLIITFFPFSFITSQIVILFTFSCVISIVIPIMRKRITTVRAIEEYQNKVKIVFSIYTIYTIYFYFFGLFMVNYVLILFVLYLGITFIAILAIWNRQIFLSMNWKSKMTIFLMFVFLILLLLGTMLLITLIYF